MPVVVFLFYVISQLSILLKKRDERVKQVCGNSAGLVTATMRPTQSVDRGPCDDDDRMMKTIDVDINVIRERIRYVTRSDVTRRDRKEEGFGSYLRAQPASTVCPGTTYVTLN